MLNKTKRLITLLLAVCMLVSMMPMVSGASISDFVDFPTGWSKPAMEAAVNNGLLSGVTQDEIRPQANLTRAEAATIIVRAFGASTRADVSAYTDMNPSAWYYDYIAKAVKMGAIKGKSATTMEPDTVITREEIFTILARIMVYTTGGTEALSKFADVADVCEWGAPYVAVMVEKGYVNGDDEGNLEPKDKITREEFAQVMYNMFKTYITTPGTYSGTLEGIVVVRTGNVTLKDITIKGDLVAADGVVFDQINLTNATINGRLLTRGGKFTLKNTTVSEGVVVNNVNGVTAFNNYRTESVFKGIIENTKATFLTKSSVGGGYSPSGGSKKVTITFKYPDGTEVPMEVTSGKTFGDIMPADPAYHENPWAWEFLGWYREDGSKVEDGDKIDTTKTITAKFKAKEYKVILLSKGEPYGEPIVYTILDDVSEKTLPTIPNIEGVENFRGWLKEDGNESSKVLDVAAYFALSETTEATRTLYAWWEPVDPTKHTVTFLNSDGSLIDNPQFSDNAVFGDVKLPAPAAKWYEDEFLGWAYEDGTLVDDSKVITAPFTVIAKFSYKVYTVILMNKGSQYGEPITFTYENVKNNTVPALPDLGEKFLGWYENGVKVEALTLDANTPQTRILTAEWAPAETYDVTFLNSDGSEIDTVEDVPHGTTFGSIKLAAPAAKWYEDEFLGWYADGALVDDSKTITAPLTVKAKFSYKVYTVILVSIGEQYGEEITFTYEDVLNGTVPVLPTLDNDAEKSFKGWCATAGDLDSKLDSLTLNDNTERFITLYAYWETTVTFQNSDGSEIVKQPIALGKTFGDVTKPATPDAKWYEDEFLGWANENGALLNDTLVIEKPVIAKAKFSYKTYTVILMNDGEEYDRLTFTYEDELPTLPTITDAEDPRSFLGWCATENDPDTKVESLTLTETTPLEQKLYAYWGIMVRYYEGYYPGNDEYELADPTLIGISKAELAEGKSLADASESLPAIPAYLFHTGYVKDASVAPMYAGNNAFKHTLRPEFWYVKDVDGVLVLAPFDETVKLTKNTDVFALYKNISLQTWINGEALAQVSADYYFDETRTVDTVKDLLASGRASLSTALNNGLIPKYDDIKESAINKLAATNVIDENLNIKVSDLAFPLSMLISEETVNGMVKTYIRDVIKNPNELDEILGMVDLPTLVNQIGTNALIDMLSDESFLSIIKNEANRASIIEVIMDDLTSETPKMQDVVFSFIATEVKNPGSDLQLAFMTEIKNLLANDDPDFMELIVNYYMGKLDPETGDSNLRADVIARIKTALADPNDADGARDLLFSADGAYLDVLFDDATFKTQLINELVDPEMLELILHDEVFHDDVVATLLDNEKFIEMLIGEPEFKTHLIEEVQYGGELNGTVVDMLNDGGSTFRKELLKTLKESEDFKALLAEGSDLRTMLENDLVRENYATDKYLVAYIFNQPGETYENLISEEEINTIIANTIAGSSYEVIWNDTPDADKPALRADFYFQLDEITKMQIEDAVKAKADDAFIALRKDVLDELAGLEPANTVDNDLAALVDNEIIKYLNWYLSANKTTGYSDVDAAIGDILVDYVRHLHKNPNPDEAEIVAMVKQAETSYIGEIEDGLEISQITDLIQRFVNENGTQELITVINHDYEELTGYIKANTQNGTIREHFDTLLIQYAGQIDDDLIGGFMNTVLNSGETDMIAGMVKKYVGTLLADEDPTKLDTAILSVIGGLDLNDPSITKFLTGYIENEKNRAKVEGHIGNFIASGLDLNFVTTYRGTIKTALSGVDISSYVTADMIKQYVAGLGDETDAFADEVYNILTGLTYYKEFINSLLNEESFAINEQNLPFVQGVSSAIKGLTYDKTISFANNAVIQKINSVLGDKFIKNYFEHARDSYYNGLAAEINKVKTGAATETSYTTSLSFTVDLINEILVPLYEKAGKELAERLSAKASLKYNENEYLQYLVEGQDVIAELLDYNAANANGEFTGYSIKEDEMAYYSFVLNMLIIADDALCWYGDDANIVPADVEELINAVVGKFLLAHDKLNSILEAYQADGSMPAQVEKLFNSVSQLNNLLTRFETQIEALLNKYLGSNLNQKFETDDITGKDKFQTAVDIMLGTDDPVFTIDTLYDVFYRYDETMQAKLKTLIDSGKLDAAMDKFEATGFGKLLGTTGKRGQIADKLEEIKNTGKVQSAFDSVYDVLKVIAEEGIEPYRVEDDLITVEDAYEFTVKGVTLRLTRQFTE
ncbi:MAG: S-layer homology domain-containing protein [Clostridia bacterium]|nr:S-layer homology domain-containing protein [Clostridia bacterium]